MFEHAVSNMSDVSAAIAEKNGLTKDSIDWVIPHQANLRIIDAVAHRLEVPREKVLINIERYGNTSAATLPLCIWDFEDKLKKGDNLIFTCISRRIYLGSRACEVGYDERSSNILLLNIYMIQTHPISIRCVFCLNSNTEVMHKAGFVNIGKSECGQIHIDERLVGERISIATFKA